MCTVSIKVDDTLLNMAQLNMNSDVEIAEWVQQQIDAILIKMAFGYEIGAHTTPHSWDNYELSPEILAIAPQRRDIAYGDYKAELTEILEKKYK